jgi:hypothetical protein
VLFLAVLIVQRLFFDGRLADRPALLLSSLMLVLGVQIFALGLIGELIIFTHARELKEYAVEVRPGGPASTRFIHGSTIGVYGSAASGELDETSPTRPDNMYGVTKLEGEQRGPVV